MSSHRKENQSLEWNEDGLWGWVRVFGKMVEKRSRRNEASLSGRERICMQKQQI